MNTKVLVIDDDEIEGLIVSKLLSLKSYTQDVTYKNSGLSGIDFLSSVIKLKTGFPSHIFVDINMPLMNGFQFIEAYQKLIGGTQLSADIYLLTSSIESRDIEKAKSIKLIKGFISKPLNINHLNVIFKIVGSSDNKMFEKKNGSPFCFLADPASNRSLKELIGSMRGASFNNIPVMSCSKARKCN